MKLNLHNDYLIGFPDDIQSDLTIKGPGGTIIPLVKWGVDVGKYENKQNTGIILDAPRELYGPRVPEKPSAIHLKPTNRFMRPLKDGRQVFEGAIAEGILPKGTLVITKPGWDNFAKRTDAATEAHLDGLYPNYIYSVIQPQYIMAYCNESTDWLWVGYAGVIMLENVEDTTTIRSKILVTEFHKKTKQTIRRVIGPGTCMESGHRFERGDLVYCSPKQGAPTRINAHFANSNIKIQSVTFVPGSTIFASIIKMENKTYKAIPKAGRVLVRPDKPDSRWSAKVDIVKVGDSIRLPSRGEVLEVGTGFDGLPMKTQVGESVLYSERAGDVIELNGENFLIIYESDLFADIREVAV